FPQWVDGTGYPPPLKHPKTKPGEVALSRFVARPGSRSRYLIGTDWVVVDLAGAPPGSCAMLLVRESSSPSLILVLVMDLLQVPPSWAFALAWSLSMLSFSWILLLVVALPPSLTAALPPPPMVDEVPAGPVEVPPSPKVEAEVPPAAPLPAVPTVPLEPVDEPAPTVEALGAVAVPV